MISYLLNIILIVIIVLILKMNKCDCKKKEKLPDNFTTPRCNLPIVGLF